ncbi:MAG: hypothetical protein SWH68_15345 [Thermodesulfobacteriota bacterium]|nr:hypothetical protein [Thermodesulfobacteriota bacterium]
MTDDKKKERVLHTRITPDLDKEIRKQASSLGISVSNLVRNILGNTFDLVEDIVTDSAQITRSTRRGPAQAATKEQADPGVEPVPPAGQARVLGWQEVILNLNSVCDQCNEILKKGSRAAIGVIDGNGPRPTLCLTCLEEIAHEHDHEPDRNE